MTAEAFWQAYATGAGLEDTPWDAWAFGDDADALAQLVAQGVKTATSSAYALYALEEEALPQAGQYSVILDSREEAVCILRTDKVYVERFDRISAHHAYREGEGDRSLVYWRKVHEAFFCRELAQAGLEFTPDMQVVCEEFTKVFPK